MDAGAGDDVIYGYGKTGSTTAYGGSGNDIIIGDTQNIPNLQQWANTHPNPTLLEQAQFYDTLDVAQGATLIGGSGNDVIIGTGGNDIINGGGDNSRTGAYGPEGAVNETDNDFLYGGGGADIFIWQGANRGNDIIADFGNGDAAGAVGNGNTTDNDFVDLSHIFNENTLQAYRDLVGDQTIATPLDALNHHLARADAVQTVSYVGGVSNSVTGDVTGQLITFNGTDFSGPTLLLGGHTGSLTTDQTNVLCFMGGTQIKTAAGEVAVESLKTGDLILTAQGETEVLWLGRKTVSLSRLRERDYPVCIEAGALGAGLPHQDLYVSADHGMILGDCVVNASALVNGRTIRFVSYSDLPEAITYYHIETRQHDEIYANGALSETFIDYVWRSAFDNYAEYLELVGAARIIPEMSRLRISSQRQLPDSLRRVLGVEDDTAEEFENLMLLFEVS